MYSLYGTGTVTALNTNGDIDNFIVFVQALEDSLIELAALSDLSDAVQALRDAEVPDTGAIDSALDGAKSSIQSGESGIDAARSSVTDIEAQLTTASQVSLSLSLSVSVSPVSLCISPPPRRGSPLFETTGTRSAVRSPRIDSLARRSALYRNAIWRYITVYMYVYILWCFGCADRGEW